VSRDFGEAVCVIIAARNAAATIARAIRSALLEPQVTEVVVVDDASNDETAAVARSVDDGSGRLRVLSLAANRGPAFARNRAIDNSAAPLISVLDADDFFLAGRFSRLLDGKDWDFVADNIVFIDESKFEHEPPRPEFMPDPFFLDLRGFVEANIARRGKPGSELAFLHPVMRRSFLDAHGLRYNEALRIGEDYDLYARALAKGARFKVIRTCGYGAIVRRDSLTRRHSTADLRLFCEADDAIAALCSAEQREMVRQHQRKVRARYELRRFLDVKTTSGIMAALTYGLRNPSAVPAIISGVATDKWRGLIRGVSTADSPNLRYLMPGRPVSGVPGALR
jgi:succinoglycan biosynthesis protein ExoU